MTRSLNLNEDSKNMDSERIPRQTKGVTGRVSERTSNNINTLIIEQT